MKNDAKNNVKDWTEEDERKYREMLATPVKRLTEEEMLKLAAVSPYPPLGASKKTTNQDLDLNKLAEMQKENREIMENIKQATETPLFGQSSEDLAKTLTDAGIKAAEASHRFKMLEIRAQLLADCVTKLIGKSPTRYDIVQIAEDANKLVKLTLGKL